MGKCGLFTGAFCCFHHDLSQMCLTRQPEPCPGQHWMLHPTGSGPCGLPGGFLRFMAHAFCLLRTFLFDRRVFLPYPICLTERRLQLLCTLFLGRPGDQLKVVPESFAPFPAFSTLDAYFLELGCGSAGRALA